MTAIPAYITTGLRFPADEILCRGDRWQQGCAAVDGEAAYAIHTFQGRHYCGYHSPLDNTYVPCADCGEKPAVKPRSTDGGDPVCEDCKAETEAAGHVCDEERERDAYGMYVSDGLADTDGWFVPEPFEAWQVHYHCEIGYLEPRKAACTDIECNAPKRERTRCLGAESVCPSCYEPRVAAVVAARRAARAA
ncbi:hypothetical protein ABT301_29135 [Streptomyces sp. NPDC000987]|uniref:hypothetical protein n=1 Tax=Streptomyces sp. NPDC000987 TaxID=3154374 RepID=UPI003320D86D